MQSFYKEDNLDFPWLKESRRPNKLQKKLKRQASEQGLEGDQVDNFIHNTLKKVERRLNRRKIG